MLIMSSQIEAAARSRQFEAPSPRSESRPGCLLGAAAGLLVGLGCTFLVTFALVGVGADIDDVVLSLGVPTVLTGLITGWLFGRLARDARGWADRAALSLGMALVATSLGDLGVGFVVVLQGDGMDWREPAVVLGQAFAGAVFMWPFGLLIFGIVAMPATFAAALGWCWVMARIGPDPQARVP
jgi:hypothetical protein